MNHYVIKLKTPQYTLNILYYKTQSNQTETEQYHPTWNKLDVVRQTIQLIRAGLHCASNRERTSVSLVYFNQVKLVR